MTIYPRRSNARPSKPIRNVVLILTQACNLNCRYCYESHKCDLSMSFETAKKILETELVKQRYSCEFAGLEIAYLGGEPIINFPVIKKLTEWALGAFPTHDYFFSIRTNGTLLTREIKDWLAKYKDRIKVGLSLDGLSEMNSRNRNSHEIDLQYFLKHWPEERIKITLFPDTVGYLTKTVRELKDLKIPFNVSIAEGIRWPDDSVAVLQQQLENLLPLYRDDISEGIASGLFPFDPFEFYQNPAKGDVEFCGRYQNVVCYDVDGEDYCCHLFSPVVLGREQALACKKRYKNLEWVKRDPICAACPIRTVCKPCFAFHCKLAGDVNVWVGRETYCNVKKMQARMSAKYYLAVVDCRKCDIKDLPRDDQFRIELSLRMLNDGI